MTTPNDIKKPEALPFAAFLESIPPGAERTISDLFTSYRTPEGKPVWTMNSPKIQLHCPIEETCGGNRTFERALESDGQLVDIFLNYYCCNCRRSFKTYALRIVQGKTRGATGSAVKFGEIPMFGPPVPPRLISMIGPDRELFLKGRRTESQSLGIGAFSYYRRVVENQKDRLLGELHKAAERLGADEELLSSIDRAKDETKFSKSIDLVKDAIPDGLQVKGKNPLKMLHRALSKGMHNLNDEECLEQAQAVRVILTELASNITRVLKERREVDNAAKLLSSELKIPTG